jgi:uncharacterized membrane protein
LSKTDLGASRPKRFRRRILVSVVAAVLILGGATAGGLVWFQADQASQEQARSDDAQQAKDEAAASKKAASDAYWAQAQTEDRKRKSDESAKAAAAAAKDAAATASDLASKGWKKAATDIYTADIPGGYRCTRLACNQFLVMTTAKSGCPRGIIIRGRWLQGGVVTGPVTEITGPLFSGEQASVEVLDYTGAADSLDLTDFRCN